MFESLKQLFPPVLTPEARKRLRETTQVNSAGFDPWGMNPDTTETAMRYLAALYRHYFRVSTVGIERVPAGRVMLVPNHGGQLPIDGLMIALSMVLEADPPRIVRGMVERWIPSLPFVSTLFTRCGQVVGDPENCKALLRRDQAIMVFPEGVRGSGKTWWRRYQLQPFGTGFLRLALETDTPIVPVAVIGAEEAYPSVYNAAWLARLLKMPYVPVTPFWPLLGPLGVLPLPTQVQIRFGEPLHFGGHSDEPDGEVQGKVERVREAIRGMIAEGLAERPLLNALRPISVGGGA